MMEHSHTADIVIGVIIGGILSLIVAFLYIDYYDYKIIDYICERDPNPAACTEELR